MQNCKKKLLDTVDNYALQLISKINGIHKHIAFFNSDKAISMQIKIIVLNKKF